MCINVQSVPNPLFHRRGYFSEYGKICELPSQYSPSTEFIDVPCGVCPECRDSYFTSILQRALLESLSSYLYFVTLTYDDSHIPFIDLDGERILYADYTHVQNMFKRFRDSHSLDREFRYLCVNEYGDTFSRPHIHILIFVSKKHTDDDNTPYDIEHILYDNLKRFWAINVGTRKSPIYEPLFTFAQRISSDGRIMSNYWVKYVESNCFYDSLKDIDDSSNIRAIRYLIGYVNKSTRLDSFISKIITNHLHDSLLCCKLKKLLSSRLRFSKGFGFGFTEYGDKFFLPKISVRASSNLLIYQELCSNLPDNVDDFEKLYPDLFNNVLVFIRKDKYRNFSSLDHALKSFNFDDFYLHCLTLRYFPNHFNYHYNQLFKSELQPTISLFFNVNHTLDYSLKNVVTTEPVDSPLYNLLRNGVDEGIRNKLPFIAFPLKSISGYVPLCKFYRDRVCTFEDMKRMYESLGVKNYEEWRSHFLKSYNMRKCDKSLGNELKYSEHSEFIFEKQKKSLSLLRRNATDLYSSIFVL